MSYKIKIQYGFASIKPRLTYKIVSVSISKWKTFLYELKEVLYFSIMFTLMFFFWGLAIFSISKIGG